MGPNCGCNGEVEKSEVARDDMLGAIVTASPRPLAEKSTCDKVGSKWQSANVPRNYAKRAVELTGRLCGTTSDRQPIIGFIVLSVKCPTVDQGFSIKSKFAFHHAERKSKERQKSGESRECGVGVVLAR